MYANVDDVVFGFISSGRDLPVEGITKMIGLCISSIPMRVKIDNFCQILEMLKQVQKDEFAALRHSTMGLIEIKNIHPQFSAQEMFHTLVNCRGFKESFAQNPELSFSMTEREVLEDINCPMIIDVDVISNGIKLSCVHDGSVLNDREAEILLSHMSNAIKYVIEYAEKTVGEIDYMDLEEKRLLQSGLRTPFISKWKGYCLHGLFEEQVYDTPDAVAVQFEDIDAITYKELESRSNQVAKLSEQDT